MVQSVNTQKNCGKKREVARMPVPKLVYEAFSASGFA
jgi:hypothetical protein